ncbi:MAG TPA: hypothetical protein VI299_16010, partial [Polyangiales bacterium]
PHIATWALQGDLVVAKPEYSARPVSSRVARWSPALLVRKHPAVGCLLLVAAGLVIFWPSITMPRFLDDYVHTLMIDGRFPVPRSPFNLYDFVSDENRALFQERGLLPWWTHPQLKMRFLRPVSSALMWFEQHELHFSVALQHVHSFAWWVACVMAIRGFYRRVLPQRSALMALIIMAFSPCHVMPIGWIANRNALVCLFFGILALRSHHAYCVKPRLATALWTAVCYAVAVLSGELALCFIGYMLALSLGYARGPLLGRLMGLLPIALPAAVYLWVRQVLGYGAVGSGFYVDPLHVPVSFLRVAPFRLSAMFAQTWLSVSTDTWWATLPWMMVLPCALLGALFLVPQLLRTYPRLTPELRAEARWLFIGSSLALLPILPTVPAARLSSIALLGAAAIVALVLEDAWFGEPVVPPTRSSEWAGMAALLLGFLHLVHSPVSAWLSSMGLHGEAQRFREDVLTVRERVAELDVREVMVLRGGVDAYFGPFAMVVEGGPWTRWDTLSDPNHMLTLRPEERTLELVAPAKTGLYSTGGLSLFRGADPPAPILVSMQLAPFSLTVEKASETRANRARVTFSRPLEEGRLWLWRRYGHLHEVTLPKTGFGLPSKP